MHWAVKQIYIDLLKYKSKIETYGFGNYHCYVIFKYSRYINWDPIKNGTTTIEENNEQ